MPSHTTFSLVDGVKIVAPDSLQLITPYVLREQGDWFEDELRFLRRWLSPGQQVVDIGANHGVYALSMARAVGPSGRVFAFEPTSATADLLARGIEANRATQVVLERSALSARPGRARLALNPNSELNALLPAGNAGGASEEVPVTTLDEAAARLQWREVSFVKLDAEGEEARILEGGERFLAEQSPLVQFEIKAGADWNLGLVEAFTRRGFRVYRLVPGLGLLAPFDPSREPDGFLLNLFAARPDRAATLEQQGVLAQAPADPGVPRDTYRWPAVLARLPYAAPFAPAWDGEARDPVLQQALAFHAWAQDTGATPGVRLAALTASLGLLQGLCEQATTQGRLSSLARVARDFGARVLAVSAAQELAQVLLRDGEARIDGPFLAPTERDEQASPGGAAGNWLLSAALEAVERLSSFSSFYTGESGRKRLELLAQLGFSSEEMTRRLDLVRRRFPAAEQR
jgi:FkbM family methyltransferase